MSMCIRNPRAAELARELAEETGESLTQVVISSLEERLERLRGRRVATNVYQEIMAISRHCSSLPDLDTRSPDEILGYDEKGATDGH